MDMIAVQVALEKLASFVAEETRFLGGVRGAIVELQDDLYSMKSFLQDAEERSESDQGLRAWVKQVRDVAYDAEDILEEFMLRFAPSHGSGFIHYLRNSYRSIRKLSARHRLAVQLQSIKARVKAISERRNAFSLNRIDMPSTSGEELCCDPSGFSKLKRLGLHELERLRRIRIAKGSMPGLERLDITACTVLETVPDGIENLKNIGDLVLWYMPSTFIKTIESYRGEDF
ncbi:hypothetical protein NC653_012629 [Populus alba x Populus x berolinensis]|uniref:Disease resistance N-terminal domain-containing protein n=1 Tax=Populus alba x Populus x berolinensis TaxID=444605 RepID=A0AAD6QSE2_9ROSI|nr:hypothetical protein NC653_012629 [Populus alba x Populus x berolinensis]